jgi:hypothetical protein
MDIILWCPLLSTEQTGSSLSLRRHAQRPIQSDDRAIEVAIFENVPDQSTKFLFGAPEAIGIGWHLSEALLDGGWQLIH